MKMAAALMMMAVPAATQAQVVVPVATPDPARVAAARELIDILLPPATREQMIAGIMAPMMANMRRALSEAPGFNAEIDSDPKLRAVFDQFIAAQEAKSTAMMRAALPGMVPAMANAYARRFDLQQLRELRTFFETPTGRAYMQASYTIMSDPDIAAWQRDLMTRSMERMQQDIAAFVQQVAAAAKQP